MLLTLNDVCQKLNITYPRAAQLARENVLPVVRIGRQIRIDPAKLQAFIDGGGHQLPGIWRRERPAA